MVSFGRGLSWPRYSFYPKPRLLPFATSHQRTRSALSIANQLFTEWGSDSSATEAIQVPLASFLPVLYAL